MSSCESLFVECWKAGIKLSVNGDKLHLEAPSNPPDDLLARLKEHKPEMLREARLQESRADFFARDRHRLPFAALVRRDPDA